MSHIEPGNAASATAVAGLVDSVAAGLVGHKRLAERLVIALLAGGPSKRTWPPGIAKTRAVKRLAQELACSHARIQCTPDLLPSDLTGTQVFRPESGGFDFLPGPIFHALVLVDEINRAPPKVQSALLEAMAEAQVTTAGISRPLPDPFMVVATQNPIEHEGTFPLPEAQMDRFLLHLSLDLPDAETERGILDLVEAEAMAAATPLAAETAFAVNEAQISAARQAVAQVHLAPALKDFIVRLVIGDTSRRRGGGRCRTCRVAARLAGAGGGGAGAGLAGRARPWPARGCRGTGRGRAGPPVDPELAGPW